MFFATQDPKPLIITLQPQPSDATSLADVIVGSLGIAGVLVLFAAALGGLVAIGLIYRHRRHRPEDDRLPSISPVVSPPSSQLR
jgi:hypothetical protein